MGQPGGEPLPTFGAALEEARQQKERTYPELSGDGGRARLVVLAAEVGGRWSPETAEFLCALAKARAQSEPLLLQGRAQAAWLPRWSAMSACSAARSFTTSLVDRRPVLGTGTDVPSAQEVLRDDRFSEVAGYGSPFHFFCFRKKV